MNDDYFKRSIIKFGSICYQPEYLPIFYWILCVVVLLSLKIQFIFFFFQKDLAEYRNREEAEDEKTPHR